MCISIDAFIVQRHGHGPVVNWKHAFIRYSRFHRRSIQLAMIHHEHSINIANGIVLDMFFVMLSQSMQSKT
jgi:hypothetical protein